MHIVFYVLKVTTTADKVVRYILEEEQAELARASCRELRKTDWVKSAGIEKTIDRGVVEVAPDGTVSKTRDIVF